MTVAPRTDAPWDGARVPMTFLGGYLGAGKTTIVNHVLATADRRIAVLVNDVGRVAVDAALIAARHDDTIELTNGCVCCSLVDGFAVALESLRQRPRPPEHVLVELSGVAEPGRVAAWASTAGFVRDAVVVAVDLDGIAARSTDPRLTDLVTAQLASADVVLGTRADLAEEDVAAQARVLVARAAPGVPFVDVANGRVDAALLLGRGPGRVPAAPTVGERGSGVTHADDLVWPAVVAAEELDRRLRSLPADCVRVKGIVETTDGSRLVQCVGRRVRLDPTEAPPTGLVVIALDRAALDASVAVLVRPAPKG